MSPISSITHSHKFYEVGSLSDTQLDREIKKVGACIDAYMERIEQGKLHYGFWCSVDELYLDELCDRQVEREV